MGLRNALISANALSVVALAQVCGAQARLSAERLSPMLMWSRIRHQSRCSRDPAVGRCAEFLRPVISARSALIGALRSFFETELCGVYGWDQAKLLPSEAAEPIAREMRNGAVVMRRNPMGKFKEKAGVTFGDFEMSVASSEEAPPLGRIEVRNRKSGAVCEGVIDHSTWVQAGLFIRGTSHG
jgi:hypothetical protein